MKTCEKHIKDVGQVSLYIATVVKQHKEATTIMASPGQPPSSFERTKDKQQALEAAELQP